MDTSVATLGIPAVSISFVKSRRFRSHIRAFCDPNVEITEPIPDYRQMILNLIYILYVRFRLHNVLLSFITYSVFRGLNTV